MEARIQRRTLPTVGCAGLLVLSFIQVADNSSKVRDDIVLKIVKLFLNGVEFTLKLTSKLIGIRFLWIVIRPIRLP